MADTFKNNKLIAEFLGGEIYGRPVKDFIFIFNDFTFYKAEMVPDYRGESYLEHDYNRNYCKLSEMKFHNSWNWLMPVVRKITVCFFKDSKTHIKKENMIDWSIALGRLNSGLFDADLKKVYSAVIEIIKNLDKWTK